MPRGEASGRILVVRLGLPAYADPHQPIPSESGIEISSILPPKSQRQESEKQHRIAVHEKPSPFAHLGVRIGV